MNVFFRGPQCDPPQRPRRRACSLSMGDNGLLVCLFACLFLLLYLSKYQQETNIHLKWGPEKSLIGERGDLQRKPIRSGAADSMNGEGRGVYDNS